MRPRLALCLPVTLVWLVDAALTLYGQTAVYWARFTDNPPEPDPGRTLYAYGHAAREMAPVGRALLERHPLAFVAGTVVELAAVCLLIGLLPARLAVVICLTATLGHTWGSTTWVTSEFRHGYQLAHVYFLAVATVTAASLRVWFTSAAASDRPLPSRTPGWLRWLSVGAALLVLGYLFVWPHPR